MVTRAVTGERYVVDPELARPERGRALERFVSEHGVGLVLASVGELAERLDRADLAELRATVGRARPAFTIEGNIGALLDLYEASFEPRWFEAAREIAEEMIERFADGENGGFFTTAADAEALIARRKEIGDHPIPSGNSAAALGLLRLGALTGDGRFSDAGEGVLRLFSQAASSHPEAFGHLLRAVDFHLGPQREVALIAPMGSGPQALSELARAVRSRLRPRTVLAGGTEGTDEPELLADRPAVQGKASAYVCSHFSCRAPVSDPRELEALLSEPV